ncbi:helix-turn-helix domain-containing protein [Robertmurraya massiliosenegalensis]|uniref:helix-turn-helix domain-containing protein n=1 Tax=Robertmurraya massiliosenegalensis TaxID=1287657 RepID=UPI0002EC5D3F|nr:helix-turn-helix transcriptional regulator [Robertmurraya massiliosenegalensis]
MASIGDNIKLYRERANMSQEELAVKIRVGTTRIEKYESGQHIPTKETLLKISTVLDVPATELLQSYNQINETMFEQM